MPKRPIESPVVRQALGEADRALKSLFLRRISWVAQQHPTEPKDPQAAFELVVPKRLLKVDPHEPYELIRSLAMIIAGGDDGRLGVIAWHRFMQSAPGGEAELRRLKECAVAYAAHLIHVGVELERERLRGEPCDVLRPIQPVDPA